MMLRAVGVLVVAASLGGCSTVSSMWSKLRGNDDAPQAATLSAAPAETAAAPSTTTGVCDRLRENASPATVADAASRQLAIDEMKRAGCADVPAQQ